MPIFTASLWALEESISPVPLPSDAPNNRSTPTPGLATKIQMDDDMGKSNYSSTREEYHPLYRFSDSYYSDILSGKPPLPYPEPELWDYRGVMTQEYFPNLYKPHPIKNGTWILTPRVFMAQRYDDNLFMTHDDKVRAAYYNLGFGADFSAGSVNPESYGYDTITSLSGTYLFNADIFNDYQKYNKISNHIELEGRIGRDKFILRPYIMAEEKTGSEVASVEQTGRTTTQTLVSGLKNSSRLSNYLTLRSDVSHTYLSNPSPNYRDFDTWKVREELGWMLVPTTDYRQDGVWVNESEVYLWGEFSHTNPNVGISGQEGGGGFGWQGRFWERFVSTAYVGWSEVMLDNDENIPSTRAHQSGIRFGGFSRFEMTHRLFFEVGYARLYQYSDINLNDNFIQTSGRAAINILLSDNWYLIPQFVFSHAKYETSGLEEFAWTPMIEINYRFQDYNKAFARFEYERMDVMSGNGQPVDTTRQIIGVNMQF